VPVEAAVGMVSPPNRASSPRPSPLLRFMMSLAHRLSSLPAGARYQYA
jgi:hypothetical protein